MQPGQGFGITFVIFDNPSATRGPGKRPFDDPAARQQDETTFGFRQFHHFESDAFCVGCVRGSMTGVALVDIGQVDCIASRVLNVSSKPRNGLA